MKKLLLNKVFWFLLNWLRSRFARKSGGKSKFSPIKRHKKLSPKQEHPLKVAQFFKSRLRQTAWTRN